MILQELLRCSSAFELDLYALLLEKSHGKKWKMKQDLKKVKTQRI